MSLSSSYAIIKLPEEESHQYFQSLQVDSAENAVLHIQPFDPSKEKITLLKASKEIEKNIATKTFTPCQIHETIQLNYNKNIQNAQLAFAQTDLHKVIVSKIKTIAKPSNFNVLDYYKRLGSAYPHAATSLFVLDNCAWIAASPELLLKRKSNHIETVSLAGTVHKSSANTFNHKEFDEQDIVTKSIFVTLQPYCLNHTITINEREIAAAGPVTHLKNRIHAELQSNVSTETILSALHPTPAIAGFPKQDALDFILKDEAHDRDLYGGYWGIQSQAEENYYVHIRCMQVFADKIAFYAGGGITAGSNADAEWEEAEQKMQTLISLL